MDTLTSNNENAFADEDKRLRQEVERAFGHETHPTPSAVLFERLMLQAEATPQLDTHNERHQTELTAEMGASVINTNRDLADAGRSILARVFNISDKSATSTADKLRQLRDINWELYHHYLEQNLNCTNATSGVNF